jgi:hypothetical protein
MIKSSKNLIIVGRGTSGCLAMEFLADCNYDADVWRLNYGKQLEVRPRSGAEYHFDIHTPRHFTDATIRKQYIDINRDPNEITIVTRANINIQELIELGGNEVLANTIALQMALALKLKYSNVYFAGCDKFNTEEQGKHEEISFVLWYNILQAAGIKVNVTHMCTAFKVKSREKSQIIIVGQKLGLGLALDAEEKVLLERYKTIYK